MAKKLAEYPGNAELLRAPIGHGRELWVVLPAPDSIPDTECDEVWKQLRRRMYQFICANFCANFSTATCELQLYEVQLGGSTFWVAAYHPEHAVALVFAHDASDECLEVDDNVVVDRVPRGIAEVRASGRLPPERFERSLWDDFQSVAGPEVFAYSE